MPLCLLTLLYEKLKQFTIEKEKINVIRGRTPIKRTHRKMIVFFVVNSQLFFKIIERIKSVNCVKIFVIFSVRTFDFAVVPGSIGFDKFV